jgi:hypothetical protein
MTARNHPSLFTNDWGRCRHHFDALEAFVEFIYIASFLSNWSPNETGNSQRATSQIGALAAPRLANAGYANGV